MEAPNIRRVRPEAGHVLVINWKGGAESVVDLTGFLQTYAIFSPLRGDEQAFRAVAVGDWGWCVHWDADMEIAAETLWRLTLEQGAEWLRRWRTQHGLTQSAAATALGVSPRMWRYYEAGTHLLPKTVRLACLGYDSQARAA